MVHERGYETHTISLRWRAKKKYYQVFTDGMMLLCMRMRMGGHPRKEIDI